MSTLTDWELPTGSKAEHANQVVAAMDMRADADMLKGRYYEARDQQEPAEVVHGLHISMYLAIGKAAEMERALRGIPGLPEA
jgi:hypothetical protein